MRRSTTDAAAAAMRPSGVDGRIALTIGVTGHRHLNDEDVDLHRRAIEHFFDDLARRHPRTPLRVLSPLAEGADRIPVEIALARGYEVVVALPMAAADYEADFGDRVSAFRDLLARIPPDQVFTLAGPREADGDRDPLYERAGHFVASHCHVLLALWDGVPNALPGGTGEVVQYKLTGRCPGPASVADLIGLPDSGPVAWLQVRRTGDPSAPRLGQLRWLYPPDRPKEAFDYIHQRIEEFNSVRARRRLKVRIPTSIAPMVSARAIALDDAQRSIARTFETADALAIHYRRIGDRVLKLLVAFAVVMTIAYELYSRLLPIRAMLGLYLGAFAMVCVVYVWHRNIGALQKHLDYRALAEGLRVQFFWSLAGVRADAADLYLRKQNDQLQWIREALRPAHPTRDRGFGDGSPAVGFVFDAWVNDQVGYFTASARRLGKTGRWVKLVSLGLFAAGLVKTAALFVLWNQLQTLGFLGHWSIVSVGSLPVVGALIDSLSDSMGYAARAKQHAVLAGIFSRAADAYRQLVDRGGDQSASLRELLEALGREALTENGDWLTLRRDRPMVMPERDA